MDEPENAVPDEPTPLESPGELGRSFDALVGGQSWQVDGEPPLEPPDEPAPPMPVAEDLEELSVEELVPPPPLRIVEAMLFVGGPPLTAARACDAVRGLTEAQFLQSVETLNASYRKQGRPYAIHPHGHGYVLSLARSADRRTAPTAVSAKPGSRPRPSMCWPWSLIASLRPSRKWTFAAPSQRYCVVVRRADRRGPPRRGGSGSVLRHHRRAYTLRPAEPRRPAADAVFAADLKPGVKPQATGAPVACGLRVGWIQENRRNSQVAILRVPVPYPVHCLTADTPGADHAVFAGNQRSSPNRAMRATILILAWALIAGGVGVRDA